MANGDAFISRGGDVGVDTWTIGNGNISLTVGLTKTQEAALLRVANPTTGQVWNFTQAPDTFITLNGQPIKLSAANSSLRFGNASALVTNGGVVLAVPFQLANVPVRVTRSYACYSGSPVIEMWTTFEVVGNAPPVTVSDPNLWQLTLEAGTVHWVTGDLAPSEANPGPDAAHTLQQRDLGPGEHLELGASGRSSEQTVPWVVADVSGQEFFGGLMWSGAWALNVERLDSRLRFTLGLPGVSTIASSGTPLELPHAFFGMTAGPSSMVPTVLQAFVTNGVRNGRPLQPLVEYNTWYPYGTAIDEDSVEREMETAASLGVELFVVDAGWYVGAGAQDVFDYTSGLGSWTTDTTKFPSGLRALSDYAHNLGMKFGIWVEPEQIALNQVDGPDLARESWLAQNHGAYHPENTSDPPRTAQLCLASDAARQWVFQRLTALIDEVQPDYLKWDNNYWLNCDREGHGHGTTDGNFTHVRGLYSILSALRQRYPNLIIENCSGGGRRLDFGLLRYTDTGWMDDDTDPSVHVRHNLEGLSTVFPPAYLLSFVIDTPGEPLTEQSDLASFIRSRMPSMLGLSFRSSTLADGTLAAIADQIALYKRLRDTLQSTQAVLLTPQGGQARTDSWDALEALTPGGQSGLVFAYEPVGADGGWTAHLQGLQPDTTYEVWSVDGGPLGTATGSGLMTDGIGIETETSEAHVLGFNAVSSESAPAIRKQRSSKGGGQ